MGSDTRLQKLHRFLFWMSREGFNRLRLKASSDVRWSPPTAPSSSISLHLPSSYSPGLAVPISGPKWATPAGVAWLMPRPARWHWQLNYPTGRGGWLSAEKSSGPPIGSPPPPPPPSLVPLPPPAPPTSPVTPCQERDAFHQAGRAAPLDR